MRLLDLPDEILDLCCAQLALLHPTNYEWDNFELTSTQIHQAALKSLRTTCKRLSAIATKQLFSHVHILPTKNSSQKARATLEDQSLVPLVKTISLQASLGQNGTSRRYRSSVLPQPEWGHQDEDYIRSETNDSDQEQHDAETDGVVPQAFKKLLADLGLFSNLQHIELLYDSVVSGPTFDFEDTDTRERQDYRDTFFAKVLSALNHPVHPATKLHSLSIQNLQDCVNVEIAASEDFKAVLSQLDCLELSITSQKDEAGESEMHIQERHDFYSRDLRKYWLQPLHEYGRLSTLKLYGSIFWGYLPKCDLRGLHFPHLKSLSLGRMTFTHHWQLDWIVSHGGTLESLALDACPIIPVAEHVAKLDADNYPIPTGPLPTQRRKRPTTGWEFSTRWYDFFDKFRTCLPHLRHFAISEELRSNTYLSCGRGDLIFFLPSETLPAKLYFHRYCKLEGMHE